MYAKSQPRSIRMAALNGMITTAGDDVSEVILAALRSDEAAMRAVGPRAPSWT